MTSSEEPLLYAKLKQTEKKSFYDEDLQHLCLLFCKPGFYIMPEICFPGYGNGYRKNNP
jgi:hypothetical protein